MNVNRYFAYSGYMQRIVPVCFAQERLKEQDLAKALYANTSLSMQDFLRAAKEKEEEHRERYELDLQRQFEGHAKAERVLSKLQDELNVRSLLLDNCWLG